MIRPARITDIPEIHRLLAYWADKKLLLGRPLSALYDQLRDFAVYEEQNSGIMGICALHICWENLAEIRSLAVQPEHLCKGVGSALVRHCLEDARSLEISRVFTLTYQADFFRALGFVAIDKKELPHKVWSDCLDCPHFPDCAEEALLIEL